MEVKSLLIQLMPATESSVNKKKGFLCVRPRLGDLRLLTTVECLRLVDHQKLTHFTGHASDTRPGDVCSARCSRKLLVRVAKQKELQDDF